MTTAQQPNFFFAIALLLALTAAAASAHADLYTGLVSYWPLENMTDVAGTNNGVDSGTTNTTGILNSARSFDGASANIGLGTGNLDIRQNITITAWINSSNTAKSNEVIIAKSDGTTAGSQYELRFSGSVGKLTACSTISSSFQCANGATTLQNNTWYFVALTYNTNDNITVWVNGAIDGATPAAAGTLFAYSGQAKMGTRGDSLWFFQGKIDEVGIWNRTLNATELSTLYHNGQGYTYPFTMLLTSLNCTSCNPPNGANQSPFASTSGTPTFNFTTNQNANCRIGITDNNYTALGNTRNCTSGDGLPNHVCTLTSQDALPAGGGYVYIACYSTRQPGGLENTTSTTGPLQIIGVVTSPQAAIDGGIQQSSVWPGATVYSNQQVFLRNLNNNQTLNTVDRVVSFGNQRWLFNYNNATHLGLFNITPVVYSLELANLTYDQIESTVSTFINNTKTS